MAFRPLQIRQNPGIFAAVAGLHRPAILPAPAPVLRIALGELSHLLLDSSRVTSSAAREKGYAFRHPTLSRAVQASLG